MKHIETLLSALCLSLLFWPLAYITFGSFAYVIDVIIHII